MVHACEYVYACVIMSVCVYVYTYVYVSAYAYVCVCVCVHVYVCKFMSNALNVSIFVIHSITYPNLIRFCSLCTVQIGTTAVSIIITVSTIWNAAIATYSICSTSAGGSSIKCTTTRVRPSTGLLFACMFIFHSSGLLA